MLQSPAFPSTVPARILPLQLTFLMLFFLAACGQSPDLVEIDLDAPATAEEIAAATAGDIVAGEDLLFGFDLRSGPREDARQYLPLLDYLAKRTGYRFGLNFTENAGDLVTELTTGKLQFAAIGGGTYLTAQEGGAIIPLVRGVNAKGESGYRSIVVVASSSPLQTLQDLKGKRVAFGSRTSTQGHWIPRIMFDQAGIQLSDLGEYLYTGSHRGCAVAVLSGRVEACGMQDTLARILISSGSLRALATSEVFPSSGVFSHASVPEEVRMAVRAALTDFDPQGRDRVGLYQWDRTEMAGGFAAASADDYSDLRSRAKRLGLLPSRAAAVDPR